MQLLRPATLLLIALLSAPAWAALVESQFPGKTEDAVAAEFEAGLPAWLQARLKEPAKPQMYTLDGKTEVFVELTAIDGSNTTWMTLVRVGWIAETNRYGWGPYGKEYKLALADIPAREVAGWFVPKFRTPQEIVALACWLASKGEQLEANAKLAGLAAVKEDLKKDAEAWVAAKNGWTVPADGLMIVETHDLERNEDGMLFQTKAANAERLKELDKEAKKAFKELEKLQGLDVKSKPGYRKNSPGMRLVILQDYVDRFERRYAGTSFMEKKGTKEDLDDIRAAIKADLEYVETEKYKAERSGIDGDWHAAAEAYDVILRVDPLNPDLVLATAEAFSKAAKITNGARNAEDPASAKRAALLYERLLEIYPKALGFHNHAGVNWLAAASDSKVASDGKKRAKEHHEEVIRRTDNRSDLSESEKSNREYAEGQLKLIK
ncbi:MAG: hypothetical protein H6839_09055 [Planctomycetes bacterium]|nr:hypothetical protein [Planctomycetota bacterium]